MVDLGHLRGGLGSKYEQNPLYEIFKESVQIIILKKYDLGWMV